MQSRLPSETSVWHLPSTQPAKYPLSYLARAAMGSAAQKGRVSRREQAVASYKLGGAEGGAQCRL